MAYIHLSQQEKISLLMMRGWGYREHNFNEVRTLFNANFRNEIGATPISRSTVSRTVRRFELHGQIDDLQKSSRLRSAITEGRQMEIA